MNIIQKFFVIFFLLVLPGILYAETYEQQALDAIQSQYEKTITFEAHFTQKSYVKMMNQTQKIEGQVKIKKPGKMKRTDSNQGSHCFSPKQP